MEFGPHLLLATIEGAVGAAVLALTALGLSLVFGVMRVVNVAHGEFSPPHWLSLPTSLS